MTCQFGIITSTTGITSIVVNSLHKMQGSDIAEARDEKGNVIALHAYSRNEKITIKGVLNASDCGVNAGDTMSVGGKNYLIESCEISESNTGFAEAVITARTADSAELQTYSASANS